MQISAGETPGSWTSCGCYLTRTIRPSNLADQAFIDIDHPARQCHTANAAQEHGPRFPTRTQLCSEICQCWSVCTKSWFSKSKKKFSKRSVLSVPKCNFNESQEKNMKKHSSLVEKALEIHQKRNVQPNSQTHIASIRNPVMSWKTAIWIHAARAFRARHSGVCYLSLLLPWRLAIFEFDLLCGQTKLKMPCVVLQMHFWWITAGPKYDVWCSTVLRSHHDLIAVRSGFLPLSLWSGDPSRVYPTARSMSFGISASPLRPWKE